MPNQTFLHQGHIFTSPTRSEFPPQGVPSASPRDSLLAPPTPSDPWERCGWAKEWHPELAFYPTSSILIGTLFRTLRFYAKTDIPLEQRALKHIIVYRCASAEEWSRLETLLVRVRRILEPHANILVGTDAVAIPGPSSESYMAWNSNATAVRNRGFYARKRFLYVISSISFMIAILSLRHGGEHVWYTLLLENGLDPHLADEISSSCVSDFSRNNPRAGIFLEPSCCPWTEWLPVLINADVPLFIDWGSAASVKPPLIPHLKRLHPSAAQIEQVLADSSPARGAIPCPSSTPWRLKEGIDWLSGAWRKQLSDSVAPPSSDSVAPPSSDSVVSPSSDSVVSPSSDSVVSPSWEEPPTRMYTWNGFAVFKGEAIPKPPRFEDKETPARFFARRATYRRHFIDHIESPRQRAVRLQRENDARRYLIVQNSHDEIFEWDFYVETMSWRRRSVPRNDRPTIWDMYNRSCKRYDSVAAEWDLAHFLNTDPIPSLASSFHQFNSDPSNDDLVSSRKQVTQDPFFRDGDYFLYPPPPETMPDADPKDAEIGISFDSLPDASRPNTPTTTHSELEDGEVPSMPTVYIDEKQEVPNVIDFVDVAKTRHALTWKPVLTLTCVQGLTVADACKAFGYYIPYHGSSVLLEDAMQASSFVAWTTSMARADSPSLPSMTSWLLHPHERDLLRKELQSSDIQIFRMRSLRGDDQNIRVWGLANKRTRRSIRAPIVAVEDPTTVLAVMRSFNSLSDDVIRWLVGSGIAFAFMFHARADSASTTVTSDKTPGDRARLPVLRLISRPISHIFTADDYRSYEEARNHLLMSSRRVMRAALLSGGILWRLAIEAVSPDVVLEEPDYDACGRGVGQQYFLDMDLNPYVDDALTRDEIRVLVGMYVVSHRDREKSDNSAYPMWWPEPLRFNASSLDYGWWTPVDEHWYRKLREKYRHSEAQPKVGIAWRTSLRNYDKRSRILMNRSREAAKSFLDSFVQSFSS